MSENESDADTPEQASVAEKPKRQIWLITYTASAPNITAAQVNAYGAIKDTSASHCFPA